MYNSKSGNDMARLILVCGPVGAGKTTYSLSLAKEIEGIRFSIDPWMQTLFSKDMTGLNYSWMMDRVSRCHEQIWEVSEQILAIDGNIVLDLGFTTRAQRDLFTNRAKERDVDSEIHYLDAPKEVRKQRVDKRNKEKDPNLYAFEVTDTMFNFMEPKFEVPTQEELWNGRKINA